MNLESVCCTIRMIRTAFVFLDISEYVVTRELTTASHHRVKMVETVPVKMMEQNARAPADTQAKSAM